MDWFLYDTDLSHEKIKGCVGYIFASLKESFYETRKNVFYFTSKALLFLRILKFKILDIHVSLRHQMLKHKTRNTFYSMTLVVNTVC